jgi:hypothetical protein
MTQALQLLMVLAVGVGLAIYGHLQGVRERRAERRDPRQPSLFPRTEPTHSSSELVTR